jgi:hypothetical protein
MATVSTQYVSVAPADPIKTLCRDKVPRGARRTRRAPTALPNAASFECMAVRALESTKSDPGRLTRARQAWLSTNYILTYEK